MSKQAGFYIPSLDGIRAIAVMLVFVAHAGWYAFVPGGFGVTIFFLLSGYLITSLLRREYEKTGRIDLRQFWLRRAFRIIPPMYIVVTVSVLAGVTGLVQADIRWQPVVAQALNTTNYYGIFFGEEHFPPGTEVLWSLAVEEHYYLLYPPVLWLLVRRIPYRSVSRTLVVVSAVVLAWRCFLVFVVGVHKGYTFAATDTRIDSILLGCVLALWRNPYMDDFEIGERRLRLWVVAGVAMLGLTFVFRGEQFSESFRYTIRSVALVPIFFAAIRHHDWPLFKWLESPVMRWGGRISYTIYLIHPLAIKLTWQRITEQRIAAALIALVITIVFSLAMYLVVERHFARLRRRFSYPSRRLDYPA
jgi:peptidoglycan/LPS O-acetylase OafA/YrhL